MSRSCLCTVKFKMLDFNVICFENSLIDNESIGSITYNSFKFLIPCADVTIIFIIFGNLGQSTCELRCCTIFQCGNLKLCAVFVYKLNCINVYFCLINRSVYCVTGHLSYFLIPTLEGVGILCSRFLNRSLCKAGHLTVSIFLLLPNGAVFILKDNGVFIYCGADHVDVFSLSCYGRKLLIPCTGVCILCIIFGQSGKLCSKFGNSAVRYVFRLQYVTIFVLKGNKIFI